MIESQEDRKLRRARAMFRIGRPGADWEEAGEAEQERWLAAAHAVEASDAEAGLAPMPLDRPFAGRRGAGGMRGLGAHVPAVAAMYDLTGVAPEPDRPAEPAAPERQEQPEVLGPDAEPPGLPAAVRAMLALAAFAAAAAALLAAGYWLAAGG